jgi:TolA-binding protein
MTDVFISHARQDQEIARELAHDLQRRGYLVWWDAELDASNDFRETIQAALFDARCAVVIWSKLSVGSRFVRDEAGFALSQNKLISARTADLDVQLVPLGFQGQHVEMVSNRDQIAKAIDRLSGRLAENMIDADYKNAQALFSARQYAAAATTFAQFLERVELVHDHPLRGVAHFWCGEAHYLNGNFFEAQDILGIGRVRYPREPITPMMVVRQAMSCARINKFDSARILLARLDREYPDAAADVKKLAALERERLKWV